MEEQNPTPQADAGGASTLDRLERYLAQDAPDTTNQEADKAPDASATNDVTPDGDGQQAEQPQLSTSDLAKMLGLDDGAIDLDEDGSVKLRTKVDGVEGAAKLQDLLKSYQLQEHVDKKAREVAESQKALQTRQQEAEQQFTQQLQYAQQLANVAANQLMREFQSVDWVTLESTDPGQAALLRQKFQERQSELRGVYDHIAQNDAQQKAVRSQEQAQMLQREAERLPVIIPEWKDEAVAVKEQREIREWALKQGVQSRELDSIVQASHVAILRKAMQYDKLKESKPAVENKVRSAPVLVKPGQPAQNSEANRLQNLKVAVRKSGGNNNAIEAYLLASGKV